MDFEPSKRRWVGVLLSLLVPGFGLVRAGRFTRGFAWFFALQVIGILVALFLISRSIPLWGVAGGMMLAFVCQIAMLVDSFKPGRMDAKLWFAFVLAFLAHLFAPSPLHLVAKAFTIPTSGMEPTLRGTSNGGPDYLIVDRLSYRVSKPKRGDLVVFRTSGIPAIKEETFFVKRLIGLPRERIEIRDGGVFANGHKLDEIGGVPPITYSVPTSGGGLSAIGSGIYDVPENSYFMLGDNSSKSFDSRYWGCVPRVNLYGRVARIYYPFSRAGVPR